MIFADKLTLDKTAMRRRKDGSVIAEVPVARTGTQDYAGWEVGRPDLKRVSVYRPPETVFDNDYIDSMAHRPITDDHPPEEVNSNNWKKYAHGQTGEVVRKDEANGLVYVPMMISDQALIDKLESGKREVSCGYTCELEWKDGVTPEGAPYSAIQKNASINHIAVVNRGRAGSSCRIGDSWTEFNDKEPSVATKTITIANVADGLPFEVTDAAEAVINKLVVARDSLKSELDTAIKDGSDAKSTHDKEIAAKDAEIAKLKDEQLSQDAIDALAEAKADIVSQAKAIMGDSALETKGKSVADIRREAVKAKGVTVDGKSDDYVEAYFDTLKPEVTDAFRETVKGGTRNVTDAKSKAQSAYDKMVADLEGGYKSKVNA